MKKILFPITARMHEPRQRILLKELSKWCEVNLVELSHVIENQVDDAMSDIASAYMWEFNKFLKGKEIDLAIIRGDRIEMAPLALCCAYKKIPIAHIEGFDKSGTLDNSSRYAISYFSQYHFVTNEDSYKRAKDMGFKNVWNYASLDCEYALSVKTKKLRDKPYIMVLYHPVPGEDMNEVIKAVNSFKDKYEIIGIESNADYGTKMPYKENYTSEDFISMLKNASCVVGNSSCLIKECSVLGVNSVLVGDRQQNRTMPDTVMKVPCWEDEIKYVIKFQLEKEYKADYLYWQKGTSKKISEKIRRLL